MRMARIDLPVIFLSRLFPPIEEEMAVFECTECLVYCLCFPFALMPNNVFHDELWTRLLLTVARLLLTITGRFLTSTRIHDVDMSLFVL
uniref:Secreted protein n=1 Tax=Meloidogyne incognita TaxID=6306 RepID=A0A914KVM4_MELIC